LRRLPSRGSGASRRDRRRYRGELLYPVTERPFRELYEMAAGWSATRRQEVMDVALPVAHAARRHAAGFRGGLTHTIWSSTSERTAICIVIEGPAIPSGLHRGAGYDTPELVENPARRDLPPRHEICVGGDARAAGARSHYLLPFGGARGSCSRWISPSRVYLQAPQRREGHFKLPEGRLEMKRKMEELERNWGG